MKAALLTILKRMGIFHLSRLLFRNNILILCYHGFAIRDEHVFDPSLFQSPKTFARRMDLLKRLNSPVIPLGRAIDEPQHRASEPRFQPRRSRSVPVKAAGRSRNRGVDGGHGHGRRVFESVARVGC